MPSFSYPEQGNGPSKDQPQATVHELGDSAEDTEDTTQKKIILCFDGTSNSFQGDDSDTNVVKLFEMFNRLDKHQYHYYQPGIGTYVEGTKIRNVQSTTVGSNLTKTFDQMFGSTFADHVIAGYKFLMRYYMEGDQVYIFGFSRGAYTARFLCEMLNDIGLLSKGNEENLPFLWYTYGEYRQNPYDHAKETKMRHMSRVFCRKDEKPFVYFLGLWDCVNSVATFAKASEVEHYANASPNIALHVRHALSCHERRVMFRPTLFLTEANTTGTCEERWFAGNHGNVGGGWSPVDGMLLSDIPLCWMVEELRKQEQKDIYNHVTKVQLSWRQADHGDANFENTYEFRKENLDNNMARLQRLSHPHRLKNDTLTLRGCGGRGISKTLMVAFWWTLECMPLVHTYLQLKRSKDWERLTDGAQTLLTKRSKYVAIPTRLPNRGTGRRIPLEPNAFIDPSVQELYQAKVIPSMWKYGGGNGLIEGGQYRYFD